VANTLCCRSSFPLAVLLGGALTGKLVDDKAALSFLQIGLSIVLIISGMQMLLYLLGGKRLIYRVMFNIAFGCGLVWFMLCLLLPILWVDKVGVTAKALLFLFLALLCVANTCRASAHFDAKWNKEGENALAHHYNNKNSTLDWPKVLAPMRFSVGLYIPGISEKMTPFISVAIILFMVSGMSFRNAFPIFSLYAWGVPSCLVISIFAQVIGLGLAQIIKLIELEKRFGKPIKPKG
jgi:hypothetical protein